MRHLGEILPVDGYYVQLNQSLPVDYLNALIHLYQPLIGMPAIGLYQTLLLEVEIQPEHDLQSHHTLMNYLNLPLDKIYVYRQQLEGIGLLKTYKKETEDQTYFTYEMMRPFSPHDFFKDIMLSELLYRHIGETKFTFLKNHYAPNVHHEKGEEQTVSFHDVFQTFTPTHTEQTEIVPKNNRAEVPVREVDYMFIREALQRQMVPVEKVLTDGNKRVIAQLMEIYDLETYEIEKSLLWALTDENLLDIAQLKAACHDLFRAKHNVANIQLGPKQKTVAVAKPTINRQLSQRESLVLKFEVMSPKQLLEDLSAGHNASEQDLKMISEIMVGQGLTAPVMNVLIHYCMLQSNMRLSKPYMEKIASHWSRHNIKTAKEAMDFALDQIKPVEQKKRNNYLKQAQSKEIIPDWFKDRKQVANTAKPITDGETKTADQAMEEAEMLAILEKYGSK